MPEREKPWSELAIELMGSVAAGLSDHACDTMLDAEGTGWSVHALSDEALALSVGSHVVFEIVPDDAQVLADGWPPGLTLAAVWLRHPPRWLCARRRRLIETGLAEPASWWMREGIDAEGRVVLRDLLREGRTASLHPCEAADPAMALLRIGRIDGEDVVLGMLPDGLPDTRGAAALALRHEIAAGGWLTDSQLKDHARSIRHAFVEAWREERASFEEDDEDCELCRLIDEMQRERERGH